MLTVRNGNSFNFEGRFNGCDYSFPAGKVTAISDEAARHIFGIGSADKTDVLVRHGWLTHSAHMDDAIQKLNGFSFDVSNELQDGQVIDVPAEDDLPPEDVPDEPIEQGSAPLQMAAEEEEASSEATESSASTITDTPKYGGSILDRLSGS